MTGIALDDLCMQCDNGFHARALHGPNGCEFPGCTCKVKMMESRGDLTTSTSYMSGPAIPLKKARFNCIKHPWQRLRDFTCAICEQEAK